MMMKNEYDTVGKTEKYWRLPDNCTQEEIDEFDPIPFWMEKWIKGEKDDGMNG